MERFNEIKKDMMSLKISSLWKCRGGDKNEVQSHYTVNDRKDKEKINRITFVRLITHSPHNQDKG